MSLTPSADDPNRKKELARKKKDPLSFGVFGHDEKPSDWKPKVQIALEKAEEAKKEVKK